MPVPHRRVAFRVAFLALLSAALMAMTATAASAATYTVSTTNDDDPAVPADGGASARGGPGINPTPGRSLRESVASANATPANDTINVPAGEYVLTNRNDGDGSADLDLQSFNGTGPAGALAIVGESARTTTVRSKGDNAAGTRVLSRIFELNGGTTFDPGTGVCAFAPGALVELRNLRIADGVMSGDGGGGIRVNDGSDDCDGESVPESDARLTVRESAVVRNSANGQGGGISNFGEVTLINSLVAGNDANDDGGGIYSEDSVTLVNTTVAANQADDDGGGIRAFAFNIEPVSNGGDERTGTVDATNATIVFNESDGSGGGFSGSAFFGPGPSLLTVRNTIIANNRTLDDQGSNCFRPSIVVSRGNNLENEDTFGFDAAGDKTNTDAGLLGRANNGGPTDTYALRAESPAVDAGTNDGCPATDQRLVARPQGARCDIGAFELVPPPASAPPGAPAPAGPQVVTQTNTVVTPVAFPRVLPRQVTARVAKSRTSRRGLRLRTTGRVVLPAGLTAREACTFGVITVQVKSGTRTVSTRLAELRDDCTYASTVTFTVPSRLGRRVLSVAVRFAGNDRLQRRSAPRVSAGRP